MRMKIVFLRSLSRSITVHTMSDFKFVNTLKNTKLFFQVILIMLVWTSQYLLCNDKLYVEFIDRVLLNAFEQIAYVPSRGYNMLDLVLCRNFDVFAEIRFIPPYKIANYHEFLEFSLCSDTFTIISSINLLEISKRLLMIIY